MYKLTSNLIEKHSASFVGSEPNTTAPNETGSSVNHPVASGSGSVPNLGPSRPGQPEPFPQLGHVPQSKPVHRPEILEVPLGYPQPQQRAYVQSALLDQYEPPHMYQPPEHVREPEPVPQPTSRHAPALPEPTPPFYFPYPPLIPGLMPRIAATIEDMRAGIRPVPVHVLNQRLRASNNALEYERELEYQNFGLACKILWDVFHDNAMAVHARDVVGWLPETLPYMGPEHQERHAR